MVGVIETPGIVATPSSGTRPSAEDLLIFQTFPNQEAREVEFRQASTGELLTSWPFDAAINGLSVSLSPDGTQASLAAQSGQAVIFDVEAILHGVPAREAATVYEDLTTGPNHRQCRWAGPS